MSDQQNTQAIVGLGRHPLEHTIQKSRPLLELSKSDLTLTELKVLDVYLSRVNMRDPDHREVIFKRGEMEDLFGARYNTDELEAHLDHFFKATVKIGDLKIDLKKRYINLWETCDIELDPETGLCEVHLKCSDAARKYIFNVDNYGYLMYKLRSIALINSRYSYVLFLYIEQNRFRVTWTEDIDNLRQLLRCDEQEAYQTYKRFNDLVLKRAAAEIFSKTPCRFYYQPIRRGRKTVGVKFSVKPLDEIDGQLSLFEMPSNEPEITTRYVLDGYRKICAKDNFSDDDLRDIATVLGDVINQDFFGYTMTYTEFELFTLRKEQLRAAYDQYLIEKSKKEIKHEPPIKHPAKYICQIIRSMVGTPPQ